MTNLGEYVQINKITEFKFPSLTHSLGMSMTVYKKSVTHNH